MQTKYKSIKVFIILATITSTLLIGCSGKSAENTENSEVISTNEKTIIHTDKEPEEALYISDTVYSGEEIDAALYEVPFGNSEDDTYICNKDYLPYLEEAGYSSEDFIESATSFIEQNLNVSYVNLLNEQDSLTEAISNYEVSEIILFDYREYTSLYAQETLQWYVDNKMEISAKFTTDKSLLYDNMCPILRGKLTLKLNGGDEKAFYERYGIELTKEAPVTLMCEVRFAGNPNNIFGIYLLGYME